MLKQGGGKGAERAKVKGKVKAREKEYWAKRVLSRLESKGGGMWHFALLTTSVVIFNLCCNNLICAELLLDLFISTVMVQ